MKVVKNLIDLQTLANGDTLQLQTYTVKGHQNQKKVYIQANLHGAEIVGNAVIYELIDYFTKLSEDKLQGEITFVPFCNPIGVNQRNLFFSTGRYNPYDGYNWNRIFAPYLDTPNNLDFFIKNNLNLPIETIEEKYLQQIKTYFKKVFNQEKRRGIAY